MTTSSRAKVVATDHDIDRDETEIDELAFHILATRQPVASDLRLIMIALKFVTDLERIGDLAAGIAKRALELNPMPPLEPQGDLDRLATLVQRNLHAALDAFTAKDADRATEVIEADTEIDKLNATPVRRADRVRRDRCRERHAGDTADLGVPLPRADRRPRQEPRRRHRVHGVRAGRAAPSTPAAGKLRDPDLVTVSSHSRRLRATTGS